jgi:hypothetical protein
MLQTAPRIAALISILGLALAGCHSPPSANRPPPQAAVMTVLVDSSSSTAFISSESYGDAATKRVGALVLAQQLGDEFRIVPFGSRTTDRALDAFSEASGYKRRLPAIRKDLEASLAELLAANRKGGGDGSTNLLFTLQNGGLSCTPRSRIVILSDGIEASETYAVAPSLAANKAVHLPAPSTPFLKGCSITFIGIGISPMGDGQAETLPDAQLKALIAGWREYFQAAGVAPADIQFQSIL